MTTSINISIIQKRFPLIQEIGEVMGVWEVHVENCPVRLKIKVLRISTLDQFQYMGVANYSIKNPDQADPYRSLSNKTTVQEALEDAIMGFLTFYKPERVSDTKFIPDEDW